MTLREIFNAILDHEIQFEFAPLDWWGVLAGACLVIVVLIVLYMWFFPFDGDNGWYI